MMSSIILAKLLGLFFTVMGIGFIFNRARIKQVVGVLAENVGLQFVATLLPLLLGSFIVAYHNTWPSDWTMLITIVGWLIFIAGVVRAIFPSFWLTQVNAHKDRFAAGWVGSILLILGLVLLYFGYLVAM